MSGKGFVCGYCAGFFGSIKSLVRHPCVKDIWEAKTQNKLGKIA